MKKYNYGISLIVLVITIIVMIIIATVVISALSNGNIIENANKAVDESNLKEVQTAASLGWMEAYTSNNTTVQGLQQGVETYLTANGIDVNKYSLTVTTSGVTVTPKSGKISILFDKNGMRTTSSGYDANRLHIGDFVAYDAGTWTQSEISAIVTGKNDNLRTANGIRQLPPDPFQFGGFTVGDSRNGSAVPYTQANAYVQEKNEGVSQTVTGWRVFDVNNETGIVTLISAGCPEAYKHYCNTDYSYMSEYVLTGRSKVGDYSSTHTKRNWDVYKNSNATNVAALTIDNIVDWYNKYTNPSTTVTKSALYAKTATFGTVYTTQYESLIDNYSWYHLASANSSVGLYSVTPHSKYITECNSSSFGIRLLITLKPDLVFTKTGTKVVTSRTVDYTYNVWSI